MGLRILHTGDIHIGYETYGHINPGTGINRKMEDTLHRFDDAIDWSIDQSIDCFVFAGDAFKLRSPTPLQLNEFGKRVRRLSDAAVPTVLMPGNHDTSILRGTTSAITIFDTLSLPHITVCTRPGLYQIETRGGPLLLGAIPYPLRDQWTKKKEIQALSFQQVNELLVTETVQNIRRLQKEVQKPKFRGIPRILMAHIAVETAQWNSGQKQALASDLAIPLDVLRHAAFDYVALAHIHRHQDLNEGDSPPVVYCGSLEPIDFSEEDSPKGWVLVHLERGQPTSYTHIPQYRVPQRRFLTVRLDVPAGEDATKFVLDALEKHAWRDTILRVEVSIQEGDAHKLDATAVRKAVDGAFFWDGLRVETRERASRRKAVTTGLENLSAEEILAIYVSGLNLPSDRAKLLIREGQKIIRESGEKEK